MSESNPSTAGSEALIDVNVSLSRWPTRRMPDDRTPRLLQRLSGQGVVEAWAGSFDGLFHKDLAAANVRLAEECQAAQELRLIPFGAINPTLPRWEEDLRRCVEVHGMPGIRLHPNYHGYGLEDPRVERLFELATEHKLIVQITATMEDTRMMHPLLRLSPVDFSPLPAVLKKFPDLPIVLLNALKLLSGTKLTSLIQAGAVYAELSMLEGMAGLERLLPTVSHKRILFGSHAPFQYVMAAMLKLRESQLPAFQRQAIVHDNAHQLLRGESNAAP